MIITSWSFVRFNSAIVKMGKFAEWRTCSSSRNGNGRCKVRHVLRGKQRRCMLLANPCLKEKFNLVMNLSREKLLKVGDKKIQSFQKNQPNFDNDD